MTQSVRDFGIEMACLFLAGTSEYANKGSAYICEYEGFTSTPSEIEFLEGWNTVMWKEEGVL